MLPLMLTEKRGVTYKHSTNRSCEKTVGRVDIRKDLKPDSH